MNFRDFFRSKPVYLGANIDTRTPEAKALDWNIKEIVASLAVVDWKETPPDQIRRFPVQNQYSTSSCVAQSRRKLYRILFKVNRGLDLDFSAMEFYRRRGNYPAEGMGADDAISLCRNGGMTLDALVPSEAIKTEGEANKLVITQENIDIAKVFVIPHEVTFDAGDLEAPAGTIQKTRKGVMMWFFFTNEEWSREVPVIIDTTLGLYSARALRHSVVGVEPVMYKGKEGVWIDDSAHFGGLSKRFITKDFYEARNFWASYPVNFKFQEGGVEKPSYDGSVKSLQDCLKYEGVFPLDRDSTGIFGPITTDAVKKFQAKYGMEQVGKVGPLTTQKLNEKYP